MRQPSQNQSLTANNLEAVTSEKVKGHGLGRLGRYLLSTFGISDVIPWMRIRQQNSSSTRAKVVRGSRAHIVCIRCLSLIFNRPHN